MFNTIFSIIVKNPPSIAIAIAGILTLSGKSSEAALFLTTGILLQGLWLLGRHFL